MTCHVGFTRVRSDPQDVKCTLVTRGFQVETKRIGKGNKWMVVEFKFVIQTRGMVWIRCRRKGTFGILTFGICRFLIPRTLSSTEIRGLLVQGVWEFPRSDLISDALNLSNHMFLFIYLFWGICIKINLWLQLAKNSQISSAFVSKLLSHSCSCQKHY